MYMSVCKFSKLSIAWCDVLHPAMQLNTIKHSLIQHNLQNLLSCSHTTAYPIQKFLENSSKVDKVF